MGFWWDSGGILVGFWGALWILGILLDSGEYAGFWVILWDSGGILGDSGD